jgi:hypothetical protein
VAFTNAATQIYREAQGWVQVPPDAADAEAHATFARWLTADPQHLPAYERALMERARSDAVNQTVEGALDEHAKRTDEDIRFWRWASAGIGGAAMALDIWFLVSIRDLPKTSTELLIFLAVRLSPLIVTTVGAFLFGPRIYLKVRHARDANVMVRVAMKSNDLATTNTALASALKVRRNLVMPPQQTTEAQEILRLKQGARQPK